MPGSGRSVIATSTAASCASRAGVVVEIAGEEVERRGRVERGAEAGGEERGAGHGAGVSGKKQPSLHTPGGSWPSAKAISASS